MSIFQSMENPPIKKGKNNSQKTAALERGEWELLSFNVIKCCQFLSISSMTTMSANQNTHHDLQSSSNPAGKDEN